MRKDGRNNDDLRKIGIQRHFTENQPGSVFIAAGKTKLICTASISDQVPAWLKGSDSGWVTAEYSMLPGSTPVRKQREARTGKVDSRSLEIQRLIGRCLRAVTNLKAFPDKVIWVDCDVVQADGGTRTLAITGAWIALHDAFLAMKKDKILEQWPIVSHVAAVSVGKVEGHLLLDLCYEEDSNAEVDMNLAMTDKGEIVEIQATAEKGTISLEELDSFIQLGTKGIRELIEIQKKVVEE